MKLGNVSSTYTRHGIVKCLMLVSFSLDYHQQCLCNLQSNISVEDYDIPKSVKECREKLREQFLKNKDVSDIRVIDMLVVKVSAWIHSLLLWQILGSSVCPRSCLYFNHIILLMPKKLTKAIYSRVKWNSKKQLKFGNKKDI